MTLIYDFNRIMNKFCCFLIFTYVNLTEFNLYFFIRYMGFSQNYHSYCHKIVLQYFCTFIIILALAIFCIIINKLFCKRNILNVSYLKLILFQQQLYKLQKILCFLKNFLSCLIKEKSFILQLWPLEKSIIALEEEGVVHRSALQQDTLVTKKIK